MSIHDRLRNLELGDAKLVAVTKNVEPERIREAIHAGVTEIGENYVRDAEDKRRVLGKKVNWHMIGKLQRNKVKRAVRLFEVIQTVDSYRLAKMIDKVAGKIEKIQKVMIQVNISGDKNGIEPEKALSLVRKVSGLKNLELIGLMAIGGRENPFVDFKKMNNLFKRTHLKYLSMGMSNDYDAALAAGSNMVRLGSVIFSHSENSFIEDSVSEVVGFVKRLFS
jgi:pyridoxal phosphate enzyme (YggS family)